ncbi:hypothetical protein [Flocculibacter collagenilyticus]|uniref:hypothetical protein n=1 Tax=Flocculibacter collagenilyticus TaxID=2744479 RepID=UPI001F44560D|nr:hypothetical protein [Flocculibacter collagenilyticus]
MIKHSLRHFITEIAQCWSGLNSETVSKSRALLSELAKAPSTEPWLVQLHEKKEESIELYRDEVHGFILLAHVERQGKYRVPHNHGAGWVLYAIQHGRMAMSTYSSVTNQSGKTHLVSRGEELITVGGCKAFLPGDIHDTECLSDYVLMFRLTSCDFKKEKSEGRLIQYLSE